MHKIKLLGGWVTIVLAQVVAGGVIVFLLSGLLWAEKISTVGQFLTLVFSIWLGFLIGVYSMGIVALRIRHAANFSARLRFISTAVVAFVPFITLLAIGMSIGPGDQPKFQNVVMDMWQPLLAQLGMLFALVGFYIPSWIRR